MTDKKYDLEDRTFFFAKRVIELIHALPKTLSNIEVSKQLIRSAGSIGANYIEANESLGKKDFIKRIKICGKEAKESRYWLNLLNIRKELNEEYSNLVQESYELM
jgi:four helix bundle protein